MKRIEYLLKHNIIFQKLYMIFFSAFFRFLGLFIKVDEKQVLFQSLIGESYGDSPKVIYDAMREDPHFVGYKYIWAFDCPQDYNVPGSRKVKLTSLRYYIEALRSGIWICNVSIERGLKFKPQKTIYINTWHGVPIKLIGNAQKNRNDYDYSTVNLMCCSSNYEKKIFARDLRVNPDVLCQCGMPRNDELYTVTRKIRREARKDLGIPDKKKVILYAPTWRDSKNRGRSYQIAPPINMEFWKNELGDEYILLFRMHHLTTEALGICFDDFARDVSAEPSINKLIIAADILISDYSAIIFDFSILEKPIISFAYDLEEYVKTRGVYIDIERDLLPGDVFYNEEEVIRHIKTMNYENECEKSRNIKQKYIDVDGHATETCLHFLENKTSR